MNSKCAHGLLLLGLCLFPKGAGAQQAEAITPGLDTVSGTHTDVQQTFADGTEAFQEGHYGAALKLFLSIEDSTQSPNLELYLGYCYSRLQQPVEAYRHFDRARLLSLQMGEAKYRPSAAAAREEMEKLEFTVAHLHLIVDPDVDDVIRLDGAIVEATDLKDPLTLAPGMHTLIRESQNGRRSVENVYLTAGQTQVLPIVELHDESPIAEPPRPVPAPQTTPDAASTWRSVGWLSTGVGVVSLGISATTGLMTRSTYRTLSQECGGESGCTDERHLSMIDRGKKTQLVTNIGLAVGAVGLATGATFLVIGYRKHGAITASVQPGGARLELKGEF